MKQVAEHPKRLHVFFTGTVDGDVELLRNGTSLGKSAAASGMYFASKELQASGDYQLRFESNALDDMWLVVDWQVDDA